MKKLYRNIVLALGLSLALSSTALAQGYGQPAKFNLGATLQHVAIVAHVDTHKQADNRDYNHVNARRTQDRHIQGNRYKHSSNQHNFDKQQGKHQGKRHDTHGYNSHSNARKQSHRR